MPTATVLLPHEPQLLLRLQEPLLLLLPLGRGDVGHVQLCQLVRGDWCRGTCRGTDMGSGCSPGRLDEGVVRGDWSGGTGMG